MSGSKLGLHDEGRAYAALAGWIVFHAAAQVGAIGLSLAGVSIRTAAAWAVLGVSILLGLRARKWAASASIPEPPARDPAPDAPRVFRWIGRLACLAYAALWLGALAQPDLSADGNIYHLPTIHFWALRGRIHWIPERFGDVSQDLMNGFPKGVETLAFLMFQSTGIDALAHGANLAFLPLGCLALICLSRSLGAGPRAARFAGAAWILVPVNVCQSPTSYVDSALGSCMAAFFAALTQWDRQRHASGSARMAPLIPGLAAGLCLGAKSTGWIAVALGGALVVWGAIHPFGYATRQIRQAFVRLSLFIAAVLLVGGFWSARDWVLQGSPLFPAGLSIAGRPLFPGPSIFELTDPGGNTPPQLLALPLLVRPLGAWLQWPAQWPRSIIGYDSRLGGLGFAWMFGCVPAILFLLARGRRLMTGERNRTLRQLALLVVLAFALTPMNWWARFSIWLYALGLPCLAVVISPLASRRWLRMGIAWVVSALVLEGAICLGWTLSYAYPGGWRALRANPSRALDADAWRPTRTSLFPTAEGTLVGDILDGENPVGLGPLIARCPGGPGRARVLGALSNPLGRRKIIPLVRDPDEAELDDLRASGVRVMIWDESTPLPSAILTRAARLERASGFVGIELP